jgi:hypothetical protein
MAMQTPRQFALANLNALGYPVGQGFQQGEHVKGDSSYSDVKEGYCSGATTHWIERTLRAEPSPPPRTAGLMPPKDWAAEMRRFSPIPVDDDDDQKLPKSVQQMIELQRGIGRIGIDNTPGSFGRLKAAKLGVPVDLNGLEFVKSKPTGSNDIEFNWDELERDLTREDFKGGICIKLRFAIVPGHAVAVHRTAANTCYLFDPNLGTWSCSVERLRKLLEYLFGPMLLGELPGLVVCIPDTSYGPGKTKWEEWNKEEGKTNWKQTRHEVLNVSPNTYILFRQPLSDFLDKIAIPVFGKELRKFSANDVGEYTNLTGSGADLRPLPYYWEEDRKGWEEHKDDGTSFAYTVFRRAQA